MRTAAGFERLLCVCCHERLNTLKFCLASEASGELEWEGSNVFFSVKFSSERLAGSEMKNEEWITEELLVRMCQDGLLTVTARLGERGSVMATTTQKPDTFQCLHHSGKKSFKHLKRSSWQCFICIFTMRTLTGVTDQILLTHSRRSVR